MMYGIRGGPSEDERQSAIATVTELESSAYHAFFFLLLQIGGGPT